MRIAFVSHTSAHSPLRVGSHHLAAELSNRDHDVVHVSAPLTPFHLLAWRDPSVQARLRRAVTPTPDGYAELTPRLPVTLRILERRPGLGRRLWAMCRPSLPRALERLGCWPVDLLVIDYPYAAGAVDVLQPASSVYRATDVYPTLRGRPRLADVERALITQVDHLVATSGAVARHLHALAGDPGRPVTIIPNGATPPPAEPSARARALRAETVGPVAIFAGAVDERFDRDLHDALVTGLPDTTFLVVGPPPDPPLPHHENQRLIGPLPHADLMGLLTLVDVGLLPGNTHPANQGRSPIKVFEYIAAGLPVVARRTAELTRLDLPGVALVDTADDAVAAVRAALAADHRPATAPSPTPTTWSDRADQLLAVAGAGPAAPCADLGER